MKQALACLVFILLCAYAIAAPVLINDSAIRLSSKKDVRDMRKELVDFIWKKDGFPKKKLPAKVEADVNEAFPDLAGPLKSVDRLTVEMEQGLHSVVYFFHPAEPKNRLIVFHQGHDHELLRNGGAETCRFFLERGYDVLAFWMPLMGPNKPEAKPEFKSHDTLMKTADDALPYHPLKFFLEPVIVAMNHAIAQTKPRHIEMIGISGGGWTTTLIAALDTRVQHSFPVAGSMPIYLRTGGSIGDLEQYDPAFYSLAGFSELYILGSHGKGRAQVQILNHEDPCCFKVKEAPEYVAPVQACLKTLGPGRFEFALDTSHTEHKISAHALADFVWPELNPH